MATLERPEGLSEKGNKAHEIVMEVLRKHRRTDTGGCKAFYSPEEWTDRGEKYGRESKLVVVHDGGDVAPFFSWDYEQYTLVEEMNDALRPAGLYAEQCTCWYSAIYEI